MASRKSEWLTIADLRGGRNGTDPATALGQNECADAVNVDWHNALFARKRNGSTEFITSNGSFIGTVSALGRHVPRTDDSKAELWAVDDHSTPVLCRLNPNFSVPPYANTQSAVWDRPTLKDNFTGNAYDTQFASVDGKLFIAYKSAENRLHVWDGNTVRRAGFGDPTTAPNTINYGSGSYTGSARYYRYRWVEMQSNVVVRRSEPSPSASITPSGTANSVRIDIPSLPLESETHWELEASTDGITFYRQAQIAVSNNYYVDTANTTSYSAGSVSALTGTYTAPKSYKFLAVDQNRLLGFGSWNTSDKQNRIEFSAVAGSLNIGDVERVPTTNYVDLDEYDSGVPTGLVGPLNGSFFAFKSGGIWKLTPTGNPDTPYATTAISKRVGAVGQRAIVMAEDEVGNPAIYFLSQQGFYRYGVNGLQNIGHPVEDVLFGPTSQMNRSATKVIAHGVYHADKRQVWFWVSVGSENEPGSLCLVYTVGRSSSGDPADHAVPGSWTRFTGEMTKARASVMFSQTVGQVTSRTLVPYIAYNGAVAKVWKCDQSANTDDNGTAFKAYVQTGAYYPWGIMHNGDIGRSLLQAEASPGVIIQQRLDGDYGVRTTESDVSLAPQDTELRVRRKFESSRLGDVGVVQITIGDADAISNAWTLDALTVETLKKEIA